jgi:protein SCO1
VTRPRTAFVLGALSLLAASARAHAEPQIVFPQGSEQPLAALQDIDVVEHLGDRVPGGLSFTDESGRPVALDGLFQRGKVLDGLVKAAHASGLKLGKDFYAVDISIDPKEDAKLLTEAQKRVVSLYGNGATTADWPFWRSTRDGGAAARALADAVGFRFKYDPSSNQFAHDAVAFVLTADGAVSRYLYGVDYPARDFRMAFVEAGGGRVGTSFDKVLLSCYKYDPAKRRYAPFVLGFMRIGASLVFFALAGLLTVLWRKEIAMRKRRIPGPSGSAA